MSSEIHLKNIHHYNEDEIIDYLETMPASDKNDLIKYIWYMPSFIAGTIWYKITPLKDNLLKTNRRYINKKYWSYKMLHMLPFFYLQKKYEFELVFDDYLFTEDEVNMLRQYNFIINDE